MLADLLQIRRWRVERTSYGYSAELASRHLTEAAAKRRKAYLDRLTVSHLIVHTVRHQPRPIRGLLDATAHPRHRAPGRAA